MGASIGILFTFMSVIVIFGIIYFYYREILSYYDDEKSPQLKIIILVKNAEDEIEGLVREYYNRQVNPAELWIADCGSRDQTLQILERLSRRFPGIGLLFLYDMPLEICMQEAIKLIKAPALLILDGTSIKCKEILKLIDLLYVKKNVAIGLKYYKK
jgi:glycosyltransferase involved in cell wall biosynthesis